CTPAVIWTSGRHERGCTPPSSTIVWRSSWDRATGGPAVAGRWPSMAKSSRSGRGKADTPRSRKEAEMKVVAVSDLHGNLPAIPPCDLLLLAGDITPVRDHRLAHQAEWLDTTFRAWLNQVPARKVIGVAGNHDFIFQQA